MASPCRWGRLKTPKRVQICLLLSLSHDTLPWSTYPEDHHERPGLELSLLKEALVSVTIFSFPNKQPPTDVSVPTPTPPQPVAQFQSEQFAPTRPLLIPYPLASLSLQQKPNWPCPCLPSLPLGAPLSPTPSLLVCVKRNFFCHLSSEQPPKGVEGHAAKCEKNKA